MTAPDKKPPIISGTCFWPLYPFKVARSDLVEFGAGGTPVGITYCPFCYSRDTAKRCTRCLEFKAYHKHFLLFSDLAQRGQSYGSNSAFEAIKEKYNLNEIHSLYYNDSANNGSEFKKELLKFLDLFPQPFNLAQTGLKNILKENKGIPKLHFVKTCTSPIKANSGIIGKSLGHKFYISCEFLQSNDDQERTLTEFLQSNDDQKRTLTAFGKIVKLEKVDKALPTDFKHRNNIIFPVLASFYADGHIDAILSIMIDLEKVNDFPDDERKNKYYEFISQALGSVLETLHSQRKSYLISWCNNLRQHAINKRKEQEKSLKLYKDEAKNALYESIGWMIKVLFASSSDSNIKFYDGHDIGSCKIGISKDHCIDYSHLTESYEDHKDRWKAICEFCDTAKKYLEAGWEQSPKLKGCFSAQLVQNLRAIATKNPIKARLLIRGGGGSGKGLVAEDFHAFCMEKIGELTATSSRIKNIVDHKQKLDLEKQLDAGDAKNFFENIQVNLNKISQLPSIVGNVDPTAKWKFIKQQLIGTSWWLWRTDVQRNFERNTKLSEHEKEIYRMQKAINDNIDTLLKNIPPKGKSFCELFLQTLIAKIACEYNKKNIGKKTDWTFNFFQVNCGILGGQGAELSESVTRLFGTCGSTIKEGLDAMPGLFQTCSYVGGTLFLDEIADAPIRIQDNLLRPLEESEVSRPGWDSFYENVKNIRIIGATFKDMDKLAELYNKTLPSGNPQGFRPDLLTRLKSNVPVNTVPIWHYFLPSPDYDRRVRCDEFCFVMSNVSNKLSAEFWRFVYNHIDARLALNANKAIGHLPDQADSRRYYVARINTRFLKALDDHASTYEDPLKQKVDLKKYLDGMLDFLLTDIGADNA